MCFHYAERNQLPENECPFCLRIELATVTTERDRYREAMERAAIACAHGESVVAQKILNEALEK